MKKIKRQKHYSCHQIYLLLSSVALVVPTMEYVADNSISIDTANAFLNQTFAAKKLLESALRESTIYQQMLLSFVVVMNTNPGATLFSDFAGSNALWNPRRYLAVVEWVPEIRDDQRSQFQQTAMLDYPNFMIFNYTNGTGLPTPTALQNHATPYYDPILYISPFTNIIGFDIQYAGQGLMIRDVKKSGQMLSTPPFNLSDWDDSTDSTMAAWVYLPLFGAPGHYSYDWSPNYVGSLLSAIVFQPMLSDVVEYLDLQNIDLFLFWIDDSGGTPLCVAYNYSQPLNPGQGDLAASDANPETIIGDIVTNFSSSFDVIIAKRTYRILARARQGTQPREVLLYPYGLVTDSFQTCIKMSLCAVAQQQETVNIVAWDFFERNITFRLIDGELMACAPQGIQCNITFAISKEGIFIIEVFSDGQQISASPIVINVTGRTCQGSHTADDDGNCVCPSSWYEVQGTCVAASVLVPSIFFPLFILFCGAVIFCYIKYLAMEERKSKIEEAALNFPQTEEIIGSGLNGIVLRAEYNGNPVAIKCLTGLRRNASRKASLVDLSSGNQPLPGRRAIARLGNSSGSPNMVTARMSRYDFLHTYQRSSSQSGNTVIGNDFSLRRLDRTTLSRERLSNPSLMSLEKSLQTLLRSQHPCIVKTFGLCELEHSHQGLGLVMEFIEFGSLSDLIRNKMFPFKAETALRILRGVALGMKYLHEAKPQILHGDLKSSNVLVDRFFNGKISDFGLRAFQRDYAKGYVSVCTAPEMLDGGPAVGHYTAEADVWSFGVLIYESLTRDSPYADEDPSDDDGPDANGQHRSPVTTPPGCSVQVAAMMRDCFASEPHRRPPFAEIDRRMDAMEESMMTSPVFTEQRARKPDKRQARRRRKSSAGPLQDGILNRFPRHISDALLRGESPPPEHKKMVTVLSSEIVGFGALSLRLTEAKVTDLVERLFAQLDAIGDELGVYRLEAAHGMRGAAAAYLCATNISEDQTSTHAAVAAKFAIAAIRAAEETAADPENPGSRGMLRLRIGISSGPCIAAVITSRRVPQYVLFGDTVHLALRMESGGLPGRAQCTAPTAALISGQDPAVRVERRAGSVKIKGRAPIETYWVVADEAGNSGHDGAVNSGHDVAVNSGHEDAGNGSHDDGGSGSHDDGGDGDEEEDADKGSHIETGKGSHMDTGTRSQDGNGEGSESALAGGGGLREVRSAAALPAKLPVVRIVGEGSESALAGGGGLRKGRSAAALRIVGEGSESALAGGGRLREVRAAASPARLPVGRVAIDTTGLDSEA